MKCVGLLNRDGEMRQAFDRRDGAMCKCGEVAAEKCVSFGNRAREMRQALDRRDGEMCKFGQVATEICARLCESLRRNA